jgi:hypothetical protein
MMIKALMYLLGGVTLCGVLVEGAVAADFSKKIPSGASFGEVLGLWGEPIDKVEKTVKREVVWHYPDGALVVFKDGRAKRSQPTKAIVTAQAQEAAAKAAVAAPAAVEISGETRDLVRDIAKEVPSGPDGPGGDSGPVTVNSGPPQLIPNQAPPGAARIQQPAIAPAEVIVDDEED